MRRERGRRPHGSGSLFEKNGIYYGQWRRHGRLVKRSIGPVRRPGTRIGLTKSMAEARLRALMAEVVPVVGERLTVEQVGQRLISTLTMMGRKPSTLESYESFLRVHLVPFFGDLPLARITRADVESFTARCIDRGQSIKSTRNYLGLLHSIFEYAIREGWAPTNPCKLVPKPQTPSDEQEIRFLDRPELTALLASVPKDVLGRVERVLYLAAAMTGMRQGELLALRWMDVDWAAQRIRVSRSYVRGRLGSPKSRRSRSVPLADALGGELDLLYRDSSYQSDEDLVFAHPQTGRPLDRSKLLKRYKGALKRADMRPARFHDLRHTFGTRMAAAGVPMRTIQEWMGHQDFKTTLIYAHYAPGQDEAALVNEAVRGISLGINLKETETVSEQVDPVSAGVSD